MPKKFLLQTIFSLNIIFFLLCANLFALPLADIHVGAVYYHDSFNNNERVRVLEIQGSRVKIQFLEGNNAGAIEFVSPSDLLTPSQSRKEAIDEGVGTAAVAGLILCAIFDCNDDSEKYRANKKSNDYIKRVPEDICIARSNNDGISCHFLADDVDYYHRRSENDLLYVFFAKSVPRNTRKFLYSIQNKMILMEMKSGEIRFLGPTFKSLILERMSSVNRIYMGQTANGELRDYEIYPLEIIR